MKKDHSLRGYMERQSSEDLMRILKEFGKEGAKRWDIETVLTAMEILKNRMDNGEKLGE